jgi:ribosomal protein S18 acetylase RimI-like enzyme
MTTQIAVRRANPADGKTLGAVLADAFSDDPVVSWLLPHTLSNREWRVRRLWTLTAHAYLRNRKPCYLAEDGSGATLWAPPGQWMTTIAEQVRELLPMAAVFRTSLVRAANLQNQMMAAHPRQPKHWYLYAIGTRAEAQGRGLGSAMLHEVLDGLDTTGEAAYLESSNIRNVPLYQRHGFEIVEEMAVNGGGPTMYRMWRAAP